MKQEQVIADVITYIYSADNILIISRGRHFQL